ncbi:MAG: type II toxin-antitoxin system mRNA interferase toxin, RelE/StbE family [Patescibacteria group bacterium]
MKFLYREKFNKNYPKLNNKIKSRFEERLTLFSKEPCSRLLNPHKLNGKYEGSWSINVTGDYRAIFYYEDNKKIATFINIGTHSELFG